MRLLHTSDWHVGRAIRGRSRTQEYAAALDQVVQIAISEGVDGVLVAGDLYEHRSAAPEADALVFEIFVRLHEAQIPVVALAGNHDSPVRFEAFAGLLAKIGVDMVPRVEKPDEGGVVELAARDGSETARIVCVPFVPERRFGDAAALFDAGERWHLNYAEGMGNLLGAMATGFRPGAVNVLMGHLFTDGAMVTAGGGERELTIGMTYAVSPSRLPADASYIALGHVHKPQPVKGSPATARYAGSLLQLDFGEAGQDKSVCIVDVHPGKPAKVREIPITAGRRLRDARGTIDALESMAAQAGEDYLRVFVQTDGPVPGIADRVREALPNALDVHIEYERPELAGQEVQAVSSLHPRDQFVAYFETEHGTAPGESIMEAFDETLELETESDLPEGA